MNVLSLRIYFSAPLDFDGWRCRFNSRSDTTRWLLCDTTNTQTNIRLFQAHLHSLNKWRQSLLYRTASPPPLSASLNFLPILHLPTSTTVRAPLPLYTHLHLPLSLFLRHFQFLRLPLYLFLFAISSFFLLVYHFSFYILFPSSSVFLTLVSYPLIAKFIHLFISPLHNFILIFFFLRTFATVSFGCSYPYATLNLRLWWRYHWHCLCHIFLFGVLTASSLLSPKLSDTLFFVALLPLIKEYIISGSQGGICDIQRMLCTDVRLIKDAST